MSDSSDQVKSESDIATAVSALASVPADETSIVVESTDEKPILAAADDQAQSTPIITIEREHASDSAISLGETSVSQESGKEETSDASVHMNSQNPSHPPNASMETDDFLLAPSTESNNENLDDPSNEGSGDLYTELDEAYRDTELVSPVPVPSNEESAEQTEEQTQLSGENPENQSDINAAKGTNPMNKSHGANNHNNRNYQKGGRGGYYNNRGNNHFHNNNNNRSFSQRPFNNHNNFNNHHQNNHNINNNNNYNNFNNNNANNKNNHNGGNHNHHGGPGPMRRGGYRGVQDQRPYRREESYRGRQQEYHQQRPRDNFNNNHGNNYNGPYGGANQYQQSPQQQNYQQRHGQPQQNQFHQQQQQQHSQQFQNGPPHQNQRFQGSDHNDRQRQQRMPRGPPQEPGTAPPIQNPTPPSAPGRHPKAGGIKSIFDYAKGMQWDRGGQLAAGSPSGPQDSSQYPNANGAPAAASATYNAAYAQAGTPAGAPAAAAATYAKPASQGYGQQPQVQYDPYVAQAPVANSAAAPYQQDWYANNPANVQQGATAPPPRGPNGRDWQAPSEQNTPYKRPPNSG
ncbi:hypothetical protein BGZ76_005044, partial [Entomortierella beljakovae]